VALSSYAYGFVRHAINVVIESQLSDKQYAAFADGDINWGSGESRYADLIDYVTECVNSVPNNVGTTEESDDDHNGDDYVENRLNAFIGDDNVEPATTSTTRLTITDTPNGNGISVAFHTSDGTLIDTYVRTDGRVTATQVRTALRAGTLHTSHIDMSMVVHSTHAIVRTLGTLLQTLVDRRLIRCNSDGTYYVHELATLA
jgi:hypothetical protein